MSREKQPMNTNRANFELDIERTNSTEFEEVVMCSKCMGYGSARLENSFMIYGMEDVKEKDVCSACDGTGKVIKQTKVKFKPFDKKLAIKTHIVGNPENLI